MLSLDGDRECAGSVVDARGDSDGIELSSIQLCRRLSRISCWLRTPRRDADFSSELKVLPNEPKALEDLAGMAGFRVVGKPCADELSLSIRLCPKFCICCVEICGVVVEVLWPYTPADVGYRGRSLSPCE
jgi:hypothetical protein